MFISFVRSSVHSFGMKSGFAGVQYFDAEVGEKNRTYPDNSENNKYTTARLQR
jgi:hypothetical protein